MVDELVTVGTFWNVAEAHLAKNVLEEAGIQAFLENEYARLGMPSTAWAKLNVKSYDVQRASELLSRQKIAGS